MAASSEVTQDQVQDFIFLRELAEVYLLLDHLSGRSDKSLAAAISKAGKVSIEQICQIAWPPKGTSVEQAAQAATLLMAKDFLNATAKPANGASIAFTLLVAGDDEPTAVQRSWLKRYWRSAGRSPMPAPITGDGDGPPNTPAGAGETDNSALPPVATAGNVAPTMPQGDGGADNGSDNSASRINGIWGGQPPSRMSLAKRAYPGLIRRAARFNRGPFNSEVQRGEFWR
jgi:hypothetical protein